MEHQRSHDSVTITCPLTPKDLRRIADILESNSDQPGYDFWSALAAMDAEDMEG
jgi:hypothetical protein